VTAATAPALAADLDAGLRRLKLATMRRLAPELMTTAKTQRWSPEEFLRTLLEAELASRDESNARSRRRLGRLSRAAASLSPGWPLTPDGWRERRTAGR
jgi:DNA replication protein DnaC